MKRKASYKQQVQAWRWLNWGKNASWVCDCGNAIGYAMTECPDCHMTKPAPTPANERRCGHQRVISTAYYDAKGHYVRYGWSCEDCSAEFAPAPLNPSNPEPTP